MPKILIVDDERAIVDLLRIAFTRAGYEVHGTSDPLAVRALCAAQSFDVMLSDVDMPKMNGHDLAQWVATHSPLTRTVLMSGFDLGCQGCPYASRCHLLTKPFQPDAVVAAVGRILARN